MECGSEVNTHSVADNIGIFSLHTWRVPSFEPVGNCDHTKQNNALTYATLWNVFFYSVFNYLPYVILTLAATFGAERTDESEISVVPSSAFCDLDLSESHISMISGNLLCKTRE